MEDVIETIALKVVQTGIHRTNFKILKMIDNGSRDIRDLMKNTGFAKEIFWY